MIYIGVEFKQELIIKSIEEWCGNANFLKSNYKRIPNNKPTIKLLNTEISHKINTS